MEEAVRQVIDPDELNRHEAGQSPYASFRLTQHAVCRAGMRLNMSYAEAQAWLENRLRFARKLTVREVSALLDVPVAYQRLVERRRSRVRRNRQIYLLLQEAPVPVVAVAVPEDRVVVTVLVRNRMLPIELKIPQIKTLRLAYEFAAAAERFGA